MENIKEIERLEDIVDQLLWDQGQRIKEDLRGINHYEKLTRLLSNRGYIDHLLESQEEMAGDSREMRSEIRDVVNTCIINAMDLVGAGEEEIRGIELLLR